MDRMLNDAVAALQAHLVRPEATEAWIATRDTLKVIVATHAERVAAAQGRKRRLTPAQVAANAAHLAKTAAGFRP